MELLEQVEKGQNIVQCMGVTKIWLKQWVNMMLEGKQKQINGQKWTGGLNLLLLEYKSLISLVSKTERIEIISIFSTIWKKI